MTATLEQQLSTIKGTLKEVLPQVNSDTISHAWQIMNERRLEPDKRKKTALRNQMFRTADFNDYDVLDTQGTYNKKAGDAYLFLAPGKHNLILRSENIYEVTRQLLE